MTGDEHDEASPSPLAAAVGPRTGQVVGDRYRLVAPLAEGGMGALWRAEHLTLRHAVAVKFLSGGSLQNPVLRARFEREARVAAQISEDSKHVVKTIDHGVAADGTPWIVMELLHGEGLDQVLRRDGKLTLDRACTIVRHIARGLEVAHRHGVIHRDLKPANVFLCRDLDVEQHGPEHEEAKLLDFGVAKSVWDEDAPTREGTVLGTPGYMSPEQLSGEALVDMRTDVWALGAVAYRMLTGRTPFGVGTTAEIGARIKATDPTPPSRLVPELPREMDAVIARALAKDPKERFKTARELSDAFTQAAGVTLLPADGPLSTLSTNDGAVVESAETSTRAPVQPGKQPTPTRRHRAIAGGIAVIVGLLSLLVVIVRSSRSNEPEAKPAHSGVPSATHVVQPAESVSAMPSASTIETSSPTPSITADAAPSIAPVPSIANTKAGKKVPNTWNKKDEM